MAHEHHNLQLINTERTWRWIICINPKHELIRLWTNEIGNLDCPICRELMITEIKFQDVIRYEDE